MSDQNEDIEADTETEADATQVESEGDVQEEVVLDLASAEEYEQRIDDLEETIEDQQAEIAELKDLMLDLSTRVADGNDMGVCPDCHGPVEKVRRWFRPTVIRCQRCGEVYHEY